MTDITLQKESKPRTIVEVINVTAVMLLLCKYGPTTPLYSGKIDVT